MTQSIICLIVFQRMKFIVLFLILSSLISSGTGTRWITVYLPVHVLDVDEGEPGGVIGVHCVTSASASFERTLAIMNTPYIPHHTTWNDPADANLISLYGIQISGAPDPDSEKLIITIDCTQAAQPKRYPLSVDKVAEKVKECVKKNLHAQEVIVLPVKE